MRISPTEGRASLSADVTRASTATLSNTGLSGLDVALLASTRYRITYRLYVTQLPTGICGWKFGLNFGTLTKLSMQLTGYGIFGTSGAPLTIGYPDWAAVYASDASISDFENASPAASDYLAVELTIDLVTTGATTLKLLAAQAVSNAEVLTIARNTCVEWQKF